MNIAMQARKNGRRKDQPLPQKAICTQKLALQREFSGHTSLVFVTWNNNSKPNQQQQQQLPKKHLSFFRKKYAA